MNYLLISRHGAIIGLESDQRRDALKTAELARRASGPNTYTSGMLGVALVRSGRA